MNSLNLEGDYLTIKEFSELVGMTVPTLRHYHKVGVFSPAKIVVERDRNYFHYTPMQITTIKMIKVLSEIGVSLEAIKQLAKDRTPNDLMKLLTDSWYKVSDEDRFLQDVLSVIKTIRDLLDEGMCANEDEITVREMPERRLIMGDENHYGEGDTFHSAYICFRKAIHDPLLNISYPMGVSWPSMEAYSADPAHPARFFSLDPRGNERKEPGLCILGYERGYYGRTGDLPLRMRAFAQKNGLIFTGEVYGIYLFDELSITDSDQYLLRVSAFVRETRRAPSRRPKRHL